MNLEVCTVAKTTWVVRPSVYASFLEAFIDNYTSLSSGCHVILLQAGLL